MQGPSGTGNVAFSDSIITANVASHLKKYDDMMDNEDMSQLQRYGNSDIRRAERLGEGCFSNVFLVVAESEKISMALKCLDHKKVRTQQEFLSASRDLICEANLLSELDHQNIVKIHGVCSSTVSESFTEGEGFFMVMDVMEATLKDRLALWRNDADSYKKRSIAKRIMNKGQSQDKLNPEAMKFRIESVAVGVAEAMNHIHQRDVVLRNLSPAKIGFNEATGKVCLFDFGSARHLKDCDNVIYGTPNYMAPEVMRAEGYSLASDVYSFAMVLYEICSLRKLTSWANKPFSVHNGTPGSALTRPKGFDSRPSLDCIPCQDTQYLIEDCWCSDPMLRPSFEQISQAISDVVLAKKKELSQPEDRTVSIASEAE